MRQPPHSPGAVGRLRQTRGARGPGAIERLSLRVKLLGVAGLGIGFALAVGAVGLAGLAALDTAAADASRIDRARTLQALTGRQLDTLVAGVPGLAAGSSAGSAAGASSGTLTGRSSALQVTAAELGAIDLDDRALAHQLSVTGQAATATAATARAIASGTRDAASFTAFAADLAAARSATSSLDNLLSRRAATVARDAHDTRATARLRITLAAGLACLLLLAASLLLSRSILRVLRRIGEAAAAVAGGHLSARAHVAGHDELGRLGAAFDDVADSLTSLLVQMEGDAKRADFGRQLGEAMEMVDAEEDVRRIVEQAFEKIDPGAPMELLLADSSRAHLERAAVSPTAGAPGCGVVSPFSCVAVRKGVTTTFETSEALNACHKLRGRPGGACSAVCVPISFMGRSLGVLHATGPVGLPPGPEVQRQLVTLSRHTGMRMGTVRAFAKTELQATTDGLTGLLNRRTLENRIRDLLRDGTRFALTMIDLDRFKNLNDTYGHEAGDRALRLFAQVLRETVRGEDVAGRLGGEEFVAVLTDCDVEGALPALERIRTKLAEAVATGAGPTFTASFGLTDSTLGGDLEDMLRVADAGLLRAKVEGRDRVVVGTLADVAELDSRAA